MAILFIFMRQKVVVYWRKTLTGMKYTYSANVFHFIPKVMDFLFFQMLIKGTLDSGKLTVLEKP